MEPDNNLNRMDRSITQTKYIVLVGVIGLICASLIGFLLASVETFQLLYHVLAHISDPNIEVQEVNFIKVVDGYLVSTGLLIFGIGLYEIFVRPLPFRKSLQYTSIDQLKSSLANIIILTLAVSFLAFVQEGETAFNLFLEGVGIAIIIAVLVFFARDQQGES